MCLFLKLLSLLVFCFISEATATCATDIDKESDYIRLADALEESGDFVGSLQVLNYFINLQESRNVKDENYVKALYNAGYLYKFLNIEKALELYEKANKYNPNLPLVKIENGYLIAEKMPIDDADEKALLWVKQMYLNAGLCDSLQDIEFSNQQMKVKLKSGCCCRSPDYFLSDLKSH